MVELDINGTGVKVQVSDKGRIERGDRLMVTVPFSSSIPLRIR
ncbi:MAG: hypothetical protein U9R75_07385 [Candidatus Thermoplasmatota archaeon]|nr:hypothetical protein [Candidatus Thermoplasmatota archaeon]